MNDRPSLNEREIEARRSLVASAAAMLTGETSFFEGAAQVLSLRQAIGGVVDFDPDFTAFVAIGSETDHLPLKAQQHLWNKEALAKLNPEFLKIETWAAAFASEACRRLIARFGDETDNKPLHPTAFGVG
jgi:hypothetical protein